MLRTKYALPPLYNSQVSIAHVILKALLNYGPKIAQISDDTGVRLTFDEIRVTTVRAAQNLQRRGFNTKQIIGLVANNSHHVTPIVFASMCLGCPLNAMDASFGKSELIHMLNTTRPLLIFCDIDAYEATADSLNELGVSATIFTFGGSKPGTETVENLFAETGEENVFM